MVAIANVLNIMYVLDIELDIVCNLPQIAPYWYGMK